MIWKGGWRRLFDMRVLHVIPSLALVHGGPSVALPLMARALKGVGAMVDVVTTDDAGPDRRVAGVVGGWMERDWGRCRFFRKQTEFYKVSGPMMAWLVRHVRGYDVVHVHGLFSFSSTAGALVAWMEGVRYIIRPLGVLNHWGVQNRRRWIKRASMSLLEGRLLRNAFAVHYTSRREQLEAGSLGFGERGVVIPLGVDLRELDSGGVDKGACSFFPELDGCRVVLFLSRLDRKKGLEILLEGFATLAGQASDLRLLVAGDGETGYVEGFEYWMWGCPLRGNLYPPKVILFRKCAGVFEQDGHTQRLRLEGRREFLRGRVRHDDRKSMERWWSAQWRYAGEEALKIAGTPWRELNAADRVRRLGVLAPWCVLVYTLFWKGLILDGWTGWAYALQRTLAELVLALRLTQLRV